MIEIKPDDLIEFLLFKNLFLVKAENTETTRYGIIYISDVEYKGDGDPTGNKVWKEIDRTVPLTVSQAKDIIESVGLSFEEFDVYMRISKFVDLSKK